MDAVYATGTGFWTPGYPSWAHWRGKSLDERATSPACELLPARAARGTSAATRVALEVLGQAVRDEHVDLATIPTVFGSEFGEFDIAVALLRSIDLDGTASPLRFKHSVHNAPGGNFAVAHANRAFSTSISAGPDLVAMGLLEAWAWLASNGGSVVLVCADDAIPEPFPTHGAYPPFGFALHLHATPPATPHSVLARLRPDASVAPVAEVRGFPGHPCLPAFSLLDALGTPEPRTVSLVSHGAAVPWCVDTVGTPAR